MQPADPFDMGLERGLDRSGKHGHSILGPFAVANDDLMPRELDILHAQAQAFDDAHPGAVEEAPDELGGSMQTVEHTGDLVTRQHHGKPSRRLGLLDVVEPRQLDAQHVLAHERQRALGLILRRRRHPLLHRQVRQECLDLGRRHRVGVPLAMEKGEAFNPIKVGLLGAQAVVFEADAVADAIEEPGRARMIHFTSTFRQP